MAYGEFYGQIISSICFPIFIFVFMINNPVTESQKGDILIGTNNRNRSGRRSHPIVFLYNAGSGDGNFIGAMLTHASGWGNTSLKPEHFLEKDEYGQVFEVVFDKTFVVTKKLLKKMEWAPFVKKGELSQKGISFIENLTSEMPIEVYFDNA